MANPYRKFTDKQIKKAEKDGNDVAVFNMQSFNLTQDIKQAQKDFGKKAW